MHPPLLASVSSSSYKVKSTFHRFSVPALPSEKAAKAGGVCYPDPELKPQVGGGL